MPIRVDSRAVRAERKTLKSKLDIYRGCLKRLHKGESEANNEAFAEAFEDLDEERDSAELMIKVGNGQGTDTRELVTLVKEVKGVMEETFIMKGTKGFGKEGGGSRPKGRREVEESEEEESEEEEEEEEEESDDEVEKDRNRVKSVVKRAGNNSQVEKESDGQESSSEGSMATGMESLPKKNLDVRRKQGTKEKEKEEEEEEEEEEKKSRSSSGSSKKSITKKREGRRMKLELERRKEEVRHMERMIEMNEKEVEIEEEEEEEEERKSSSKSSSGTIRVKKEVKPKKTGGKKLPKESSKEERKERITKWIDGTKKKKREEEDVKSMIESLSATTAAILRHHTVEGKGEKGKANRPSMLEAIKIVERHRPKEKFTGANRSIDFEDHVRQFRKAVDVPGLPASYKLAELTEWFDGLARMQIRRFLRRDDHQVALEEALEKLELEHGARMTSAEEMLEDLLTGGKLEYSDAIGLSQLVSGIEEKFALAEETGRDAEFGRAHVWKLVLDRKVPHLRAKWAMELGKAKKRKEKEVKFEKFIEFLNDQKINAMEWWNLKGVEEEKEKEEKRKEEAKGSGTSNGNSGMGGGTDRRAGGGVPNGGWTRPFEQGNGWQTTGSGWTGDSGSGWNNGQKGWHKVNGSGNGNGNGNGNGGSGWPRVGESGTRQGGISNGGSGGNGGTGGVNGSNGNGGNGSSGTTYIGSAVRGNSNCKICGCPHFMNDCPTFLRMSPDERFEFCVQRRVCTKCTRGVHPVAECRYNGKCWTCQGEHHSLVHGEKVLEAEKKTPVTNASIAAT